MEIFETLEIHYHLKDESHSFDALVLNKCESDALSIAVEVAALIGISIVIETSAYTEGGLKEIWKFIGKNNSQLTLIIAIIVVILSRIPLSDSETEELNKNLLKLSIEEKSLLVQNLKNEANKDTHSLETIESAILLLQENVKVLSRRSNFYKALSENEKVLGVGVTPQTSISILEEKEYFVGREKFSKFILPTNKLPIETIENAAIEIIAPVLKDGNYQWKGNFNKEVISFSMADEDFKFGVLNKEISFQHGVVIDCILNIHKKVNEAGDIQITGYSVPTVVSITNSGTTVETTQGKKYKLRKKTVANQGILF